MSDNAKRAVRLHEVGLIEVEHCDRCHEPGSVDGVFCGQCLSDGAVLLACVKAGVAIWRPWSREPEYTARVSAMDSVATTGGRNDPVDAALAALEMFDDAKVSPFAKDNPFRRCSVD